MVHLGHGHRRFFRPPHPSVIGSSRVSCPSSFTSGHRWSAALTAGQITQNNIIFPLVADECIAVFPTHLSLYASASSLPVVYSNVVQMKQLVVTRGWLCCSHSDIFKGRLRKAPLLPLICGWQPCLLHQLHTGDLMVRREQGAHAGTCMVHAECDQSRLSKWNNNTMIFGSLWVC